MSQVTAVERAVARLGWDSLPADLAEVATLRLAHPDASLAELGAMLDPPRSKGRAGADPANRGVDATSWG